MGPATTRSRSAVVVLGLVVAFVLAVLPAAAAVDGAKTVAGKTWVASVCQDFRRWESRLSKLSSAGPLSDPTAGKKAITRFVAGALKATDTLAKDLKSAGVPSIKNGNAIAAVFANAVKGLQRAYATANAGAAALPTSDPAAFVSSAQALEAQLQTAGATLNATLSAAAAQYPATALDRAYTSTKACKG